MTKLPNPRGYTIDTTDYRLRSTPDAASPPVHPFAGVSGQLSSWPLRALGLSLGIVALLAAGCAEKETRSRRRADTGHIVVVDTALPGCRLTGEFWNARFGGWVADPVPMCACGYIERVECPQNTVAWDTFYGPSVTDDLFNDADSAIAECCGQ